MVKMPTDKAVDVEKLIDKGAPVKEEISEDKKWKFINLRIPSSMIDEIDEIVSDQVGITRTGWILQLIHRELKKKNE